MASTIDVKLPDIGDVKDLPVIEVHVKAGQSVEAEDALMTLESDKATMDVPAPFGAWWMCRHLLGAWCRR